jgi:hypothetical protein
LVVYGLRRSAALSDDEFRTWLEAAPRETWINTHVGYWPTQEGGYPPRPPFNRLGRRPVVTIGLFRTGTNFESYGSVVVDRATGEVVGHQFE